MSKRSFRVALAVVIGTVLILVGMAGWFVHRAFAYPDETHAGTGKDVEVEIKPGMGIQPVSALLAHKHVIDRPPRFRLYAMWEGDTTNNKPGKYLLKDYQTPAQVLKVLIAGVKEVTTKVTIPEGKNMLEVFAILEQAKVASAKELEAIARDKEFLGRHASTGDTVEGYLFPDTYESRIDEKPRAVLDRLVIHHEEIWNDLLSKHGRDAAKLKDKLHWSERDILTMASIVEKEAGDPAERPRIAQVCSNRLTSPSF